MTCPGRPWWGSPSFPTTRWSAALPRSPPGARRRRGRRRVPGTPGEPPAHPRVRPVRTRRPAGGWGQASAKRGGGGGLLDAAPRATGSAEGDGTLVGEGGQQWRRR